MGVCFVLQEKKECSASLIRGNIVVKCDRGLIFAFKWDERRNRCTQRGTHLSLSEAPFCQRKVLLFQWRTMDERNRSERETNGPRNSVHNAFVLLWLCYTEFAILQYLKVLLRRRLILSLKFDNISAWRWILKLCTIKWLNDVLSLREGGFILEKLQRWNKHLCLD